jgi:hypothetical protein
MQETSAAKVTPLIARESFAVITPFTEFFRMPSICPACGEPVSLSATHVVTKDNVDFNNRSVHKSGFCVTFPICDECKNSLRENSNTTIKGCLPAVGCAILGFLLGFFISGNNWVWGLGVSGVVFFGLFYFLARRFEKTIPQEIRNRAANLINSIELREVQPEKMGNKEKHITFAFTNRQYAEKFAEMNAGILQV